MLLLFLVVVIIIVLVVFVLLLLSIDIDTGLDARVLTIISFWWSFHKTWSFPKLHQFLMISYRGNKWTGMETISTRFSTRRFVSSSGFSFYLMLLTRWARWKRASSWSSKQKRKILEHIRCEFGGFVFELFSQRDLPLISPQMAFLPKTFCLWSMIAGSGQQL